MTDTTVTNLIINTLTKSQYDELQTAGTLSDTELYFTSDESELEGYATIAYVDAQIGDITTLLDEINGESV